MTFNRDTLQYEFKEPMRRVYVNDKPEPKCVCCGLPWFACKEAPKGAAKH
jgi:hypothetical protein